ncbi:hypothetical protein F5141DRAFT_727143 [Pisolithus sp. B1]|nr:hypothetical protein F5141DRAFT_727143 [Pisolithus sp. B1]
MPTMPCCIASSNRHRGMRGSKRRKRTYLLVSVFVQSLATSASSHMRTQFFPPPKRQSVPSIGRFRLLEKSNVLDARTWQFLCSCLEMFTLVPRNVYEPTLGSPGLHLSLVLRCVHVRTKVPPDAVPPPLLQVAIIALKITMLSSNDDRNYNGEARA